MAWQPDYCPSSDGQDLFSCCTHALRATPATFDKSFLQCPHLVADSTLSHRTYISLPCHAMVTLSTLSLLVIVHPALIYIPHSKPWKALSALPSTCPDCRLLLLARLLAAACCLLAGWRAAPFPFPPSWRLLAKLTWLLRAADASWRCLCSCSARCLAASCCCAC